MKREEFVIQLDRAAASVTTLPVTSGMLKFFADSLRKGEPSWWKEIAKAWANRKFVAWTEAWGLLLTCIHFEALSNADNPLVPFFPSCGGTAEADPAQALETFLLDAPDTFFRSLRSGQRRPYLEIRAPLWIAAADLFFQTRGLPFYLVEVNAGAGLNLAADIVLRPKGFRSDLVAARVGLDPAPLQLEDIVQRRWLTAAIMPDAQPMIAALDKAAEALLERQRLEAAFTQLVEVSAEAAPGFVAKNIPADDEDVGLLLLNMGTTGRMTDAEYQQYRKDILEMMKPWGERALWVEFENVRGELYSTTFQLVAHRVINGLLSGQLMASFDFGVYKATPHLEESTKFLASFSSPAATEEAA